jgi:hypothetical protein
MKSSVLSPDGSLQGHCHIVEPCAVGMLTAVPFYTIPALGI